MQTYKLFSVTFIGKDNCIQKQHPFVWQCTNISRVIKSKFYLSYLCAIGQKYVTNLNNFKRANELEAMSQKS